MTVLYPKCDFHSLSLLARGKRQPAALRETMLESDSQARLPGAHWPGTMGRTLEAKLSCSDLMWPRCGQANPFSYFFTEHSNEKPGRLALIFATP